VIGTEAVEVDGIVTPARTFIPVSPESVVTTRTAGATIQLRDGRAVTIQPDSQLVLEMEKGRLTFRVLRGAAFYTRPAGAIASVSAPRFSVPAPPRPDGSRPTPAAGKLTGTLNPNCSCPTGSALATNPEIVTPSGLTINLAPVTDASGNTSYRVISIQQTVTGSSGPVVVTVTTGPLIGALVTGVGSQPTAGSSVTFGFVAVGGQAPLTPAQLSTALQTSLQSAVTAAVQSGQLPAGTQIPTPSPVSTGQFSPSAP
jgi:hypothetical protein